jgi:hypothetical protein
MKLNNPPAPFLQAESDAVPAAAFLTERAERIRVLYKRAFADVIEIGKILTECKARCGHGNWLPWLKREFGWSSDKAEDYIAIAAQWPNSDDCPNLPMYSLRLLAAPSTPESAREEVITRAESGERLKHAEVAAIIAEHGEQQILAAAAELRHRKLEEHRERAKAAASGWDDFPNREIVYGIHFYADVRQVIIEPRREHSRKPDCVHERIERLVAGPYLELFARRERNGWTTWGNEVAPPQVAEPRENWNEMWARPFDGGAQLDGGAP